MRVELPGELSAPGLTLTATALFPLPADPARWLQARLREDAPADAAPRTIAVNDLQTTDGWPATMVEAQVGDETRLIVIYAFLSWAGAVIVRCADPATFQEHRGKLLDLLGAARPVWQPATPLCLFDILGPLP